MAISPSQIYMKVNKALRDKNRSSVAVWCEYIWLLLTALKLLPKIDTTRMVYRGLQVCRDVLNLCLPIFVKVYLNMCVIKWNVWPGGIASVGKKLQSGPRVSTVRIHINDDQNWCDERLSGTDWTSGLLAPWIDWADRQRCELKKMNTTTRSPTTAPLMSICWLIIDCIFLMLLD